MSFEKVSFLIPLRESGYALFSTELLNSYNIQNPEGCRKYSKIPFLPHRVYIELH